MAEISDGKRSQIVSKQRVADHGEVYTRPEEVNAMIDLVKDQADRIDAKFLEPACGTGNFLIEVLDRKLSVVLKKYRKSQSDFEKYAMVAIASLYGIELLDDNAAECRERLFDLFRSRYAARYRGSINQDYLESIRTILSQNIIHGDALTLKRVDGSEKPIVFVEWALHGGTIKRRDYQFQHLLQQRLMLDGPLFNDLGEEAFIPKTVAEYPPVFYRELHDAFGD